MKIRKGKEGVVLILGIIFLIVGIIALYFVLVHEGYKNMPVTKISQVNEGEVMKIDGTIILSQNNQNPVIWVEYEYNTDHEGEVEEETKHHYVGYFWVSDGTGSIKVLMWKTGAQTHFATEDVYWIGDRISIVGKVGSSGNETTMEPQAIAPKPDAFGVPLWVKILVGIMLLGGAFFLLMYVRHRITEGRKKKINNPKSFYRRR